MTIVACDGAGCGSQECEPAEAICPGSQPDAVVELECKHVEFVLHLKVVAVHQRPGAPKSHYSIGDQVIPSVKMNWFKETNTCTTIAAVQGETVDFRAAIAEELVYRTGPRTPAVPKDKAIAALLAPPAQCRTLMEASAVLGMPCSPGDPCR